MPIEGIPSRERRDRRSRPPAAPGREGSDARGKAPRLRVISLSPAPRGGEGETPARIFGERGWRKPTRGPRGAGTLCRLRCAQVRLSLASRAPVKAYAGKPSPVSFFYFGEKWPLPFSTNLDLGSDETTR